MDDAASCRALIDTAQFRMEQNPFPNRYITPYSTHICKKKNKKKKPFFSQ